MRIPHIVCDFDGTVTIRDMGDLIYEAFCPPEIFRRSLTFYTEDAPASEIDAEAYRSLRGIPEERLLRFVRERVEFRPGFFEFADFAAETGRKITLLSGGYGYYVREALGDRAADFEIVCNEVDFERGNALRNRRVNPDCRRCGNCKKLHCAELPGPYVYIGDGPSDYCAAEGAALRFARGHLAERLERDGRPFCPFETFFDVIRVLSAYENARETAFAGAAVGIKP